MILIVILWTEGSNLVISKVDTLGQFVMNHQNDLDLPTRKVKDILPNLSKNMQKQSINHVYGPKRSR